MKQKSEKKLKKKKTQGPPGSVIREAPGNAIVRYYRWVRLVEANVLKSLAVDD